MYNSPGKEIPQGVSLNCLRRVSETHARRQTNSSKMYVTARCHAGIWSAPRAQDAVARNTILITFLFFNLVTQNTRVDAWVSWKSAPLLLHVTRITSDNEFKCHNKKIAVAKLVMVISREITACFIWTVPQTVFWWIAHYKFFATHRHARSADGIQNLFRGI